MCDSYKSRPLKILLWTEKSFFTDISDIGENILEQSFYKIVETKNFGLPRISIQNFSVKLLKIEET